MTQTYGKRFAVILASLILSAPAWTPSADARVGGGGGGGAQAGGARAGGGANAGAARQTAQVNNARADARTNNVRSTSVNNVNSNVNVNRNTNVNVNVNNNGCCGGGWDNDYHPVATAAAVTATVAMTSAVIGSMTRTIPPSCVPINYGGMVYQQCGTTWYLPQAGQYVVVNPPY